MNHVNDHPLSEFGKQNVNPANGGRTGSWVLYWVLVVIASVIMFVRFPPADLTGWISANLGVPIGVPYLVAAVLLFMAARVIWNTQSRTRTFARITMTFAGVVTLIGITLLFTVAP